ncbi:unnamed protein product [Chilo suppressalis]|uniref:Mpv17-like protein n=1 Tax=Chilo suppressalis TaxID=168631 RepID=A0ABN8AYY7_CHISP|nr:unnamed protein product [Chilo suppressalis]
MSGVFTKFLSLPFHFPLVRGMVSYAIIWPTCSIVQEYLEKGTTLENANWGRAARFGVFGTFFMAPVFYGWLKYSSRFFTRKDLITAMTRAVVEQVSYSPLAMAYFFFGMSVLEGKRYKECVKEVQEKFWPTYKVGVIFWPTAQTLNFYLVSEKNRMVFVSAASFVWTVYLAHMKAKELKNENFILESQLQVTSMPNKTVPLEPDTLIPIVAELNSDLNDQTAVVEGQGVEEVNDNNPMLVLEGNSEALEKKPELVSDIHEKSGSVPHVVVATHSEPTIEKKEQPKAPVKSSSDSTVDKKENHLPL